MSALFSCPACDHPIRPRPGHEGKWLRCPVCEQRFQVAAAPVAHSEGGETRARAAVPDAPAGEAAATAPVAATVSPGFSFWRGVVGGVSVVALVAVIVIGVRGLWPARRPVASAPPPANNGEPGRWLGGVPMPRGEDPKRMDWDKDRIDFSEEQDFPLNPGTPEAPVQAQFSLQGKIPPYVALASSPTGHLLATSERGELCVYRQADYTLLHKVILPGPAYALALDAAKGRLYAAVTTAPRLPVHTLKAREHPLADIHAYDVKKLLSDKPTEETHLQPLAVRRLGESVLSLLLGRDGQDLFLIAETSHDSHLRRLRTEDLHPEQELPLRNGSVNAMSLSPDGSRLFLLASGRLLSLEPSTWKERNRTVVGLNFFSPISISNKHVILIDRQITLQMIVVDTQARKSLARWELSGLEGRISLTRSPDGQRVYIGSSAVLHGQIWEVDCQGERLTQPVVTRVAYSNHERVFRGPVQISSDGRSVFLGNGLILGGDL